MIRTKGEAGTGNVVEAVRHIRTVNREIRQLHSMPMEEVMGFCKTNGLPYELALEVVKLFLNTEFEGGRHKRRVDKISC